MRVQFHKRFKKAYDKLSVNLKKQADNRLILFRQDPFNELLNNHSLNGEYEGCRSINISGDWRAIYKLINADLAYFIDIGTHSKLYK